MMLNSKVISFNQVYTQVCVYSLLKQLIRPLVHQGPINTLINHRCVCLLHVSLEVALTMENIHRPGCAFLHLAYGGILKYWNSPAWLEIAAETSGKEDTLFEVVTLLSSCPAEDASSVCHSGPCKNLRRWTEVMKDSWKPAGSQGLVFLVGARESAKTKALG